MPTLKKKKKLSKEQMHKNDVPAKKHPTSKTCWKSFEREVASLFGTKRVPLSGSNSGHNTMSDSLHPDLYIECKVRAKVWLHTLYNDTEKKAKFEEKIPVVAIRQKGQKGYLLVMKPEYLQKIAEIQRKSFSGKK